MAMPEETEWVTKRVTLHLTAREAQLLKRFVKDWNFQNDESEALRALVRYALKALK